MSNPVTHPFDLVTFMSLLQCFQFQKCPHEALLQTLKANGGVSPETGFSIVEIIRYNGYPVEVHEVVTEDGYILQVHRIPYGRNATKTRKKKESVIFSPGLFANGFIFLILDRNSLPFLLADAGFDVWLLNPRGNSYSRRHIKYDAVKEPEKFFDYSLTEVGMYDVPASIDHILKVTRKKTLFYLGHSRGATDIFVMMSERPEYNEKIKLAVLFAPPVHLDNMLNPIALLLSPAVYELIPLAESLGIYSIAAQNGFLTYSFYTLCNNYSPYRHICVALTNLVGGWNVPAINELALTNILGNYPDGSSVYSPAHYGQMVNTGRFAKYDYGPEKNLKRYGQVNPPEFNISRINCPLAFYYGLNDALVTPDNVEKLSRQMRSLVVYHKVEDEKFSHIDFVLHKDVKKLVYDKVVRLYQKYS